MVKARDPQVFPATLDILAITTFVLMTDSFGTHAIPNPHRLPGTDAGVQPKSKAFKGGQLSTSNVGMFQVLTSCPSVKSGFDTQFFFGTPSFANICRKPLQDCEICRR